MNNCPARACSQKSCVVNTLPEPEFSGSTPAAFTKTREFVRKFARFPRRSRRLHYFFLHLRARTCATSPGFCNEGRSIFLAISARVTNGVSAGEEVLGQVPPPQHVSANRLDLPQFPPY